MKKQAPPKSWIDSKPSNRLQKLNMLVAIIGVAISLVLSFVAVGLSYKYGESTKQIDTLTKIALEQQRQISKLEGILNQSKKQVINSDILIGQMKLSNDKLVSQTGLLSRQVLILTKEQGVALEQRTLSDRASYLRLRNATLQLFDTNDPEQSNAINNKTPTKSERIAFILHIQTLLERELSNTYLIEHKQIDKDWNDVYVAARYILTFENISTGTIQYTKGGVIYNETQSYDEVEKSHIQMFEHLVLECGKLEQELMTHGAWKKGETEVF